MTNKKKPAQSTLIEKRKKRQAKRAARAQQEMRRSELAPRAS